MNWYASLNTLKKRGYIKFITFEGLLLTLEELWKKPIVKDPRAKTLRPCSNGELRSKDGFVLLTPLKENNNE